MEEPILITWLNDFVFCPLSIYFHNLYGEPERISYQETSQLNGSFAHESIDTGHYSTKPEILTAKPVFCEQYGLLGKIDIFDSGSGQLVERKKKIRQIFDGYVFQLYAQCFALREEGYTVNSLVLRSMEDNKNYPQALPENDPEMLRKFEETVKAFRETDVSRFRPSNPEKCAHCIYEPLCDRSLHSEVVL